MSPTQCPRYVRASSLAASSFDVRKISKSAGMAVKRQLGCQTLSDRDHMDQAAHVDRSFSACFQRDPCYRRSERPHEKAATLAKPKMSRRLVAGPGTSAIISKLAMEVLNCSWSGKAFGLFGSTSGLIPVMVNSETPPPGKTRWSPAPNDPRSMPPLKTSNGLANPVGKFNICVNREPGL